MKSRKSLEGTDIIIGSFIVTSSLFLLLLPTSNVAQGRHIIELCGSFGGRFILLLMAFDRAIKSDGKYSKLYILLCCALSIITIYATAYKITTLKSGTENISDVGNCLYFSIITWTTLGYGDIAPATPYARALASSEALIGYVSMALLVTALTKVFEPSTVTPIEPKTPSEVDHDRGLPKAVRQRTRRGRKR